MLLEEIRAAGVQAGSARGRPASRRRKKRSCASSGVDHRARDQRASARASWSCRGRARGEDDRAFPQVARGLAARSACCFALVFPLIDLPAAASRTRSVEVPERVVRMMMEARPRPPAPPREEPKPKPQEQQVAQKPVEKTVPQKPVERDEEPEPVEGRRPSRRAEQGHPRVPREARRHSRRPGSARAARRGGAHQRRGCDAERRGRSARC